MTRNIDAWRELDILTSWRSSLSESGGTWMLRCPPKDAHGLVLEMRDEGVVDVAWRDKAGGDIREFDRVEVVKLKLRVLIAVGKEQAGAVLERAGKGEDTANRRVSDCWV